MDAILLYREFAPTISEDARLASGRFHFQSSTSRQVVTYGT